MIAAFSSSPYASALAGLNASSQSLSDRAARIAQTPIASGASSADGSDPRETGPPGAVAASDQRDNELVTDLVGLNIDKTAFKANLAVLRSARETEERLLNIIT